MNFGGILALGKIGLTFVGDNLPAILTGVGVCGVVGTAWLSSRANAKAKERLEKREMEREDSGSMEELTKWEKFTTTAPAYVPTVVCAAGTIACIVSAQVLNAQRLAAMTLTCAALRTQIKDKENELKKLVGMKDGELVSDLDEELIPGDGKELYYEEFTGALFYSSQARVNQVIAEMQGKVIESSKRATPVLRLSTFFDQLDVPHGTGACLVGWDDEYPMTQTQEFESILIHGEKKPVIHLTFGTLKWLSDMSSVF